MVKVLGDPHQDRITIISPGTLQIISHVQNNNYCEFNSDKNILTNIHKPTEPNGYKQTRIL